MLPTDPRPYAAKAAVARPRRKGPPQRGSSRKARILSFELSVGLHLALFLAMLAMPQGPKVETPPVAKQSPIPIEVAFQPQQTVKTEKVAPPAPKVKPKPEPLPKAKEVPQAKPQVAHAAAIKPKPVEKPHMRPVREPAPKPVTHQVVQPKKPDLQTLLAERQARSRAQEEQRAAELATHSETGAETQPQRPAAGAPHGNPSTTGSGLSGQLATRQILSRIDPQYPPRAERMGESGAVTLRLYVSPSGGVSRVEVIRSSGRDFFDSAARRAVSRWRFTELPAETGQQYGDVTINFTLN